MDYQSAVDYIHSFYGQGKKRGLENGYELMRLLGNPHERLRCIHVAGTNGKGSVCAYLESVLRHQGYRTGFYTSPYLERYNERIRLNNVPIADDALAITTQRVKAAVDELHARQICRPTEFEVGTAIAFDYLASEHVDYAVIEVGLGGRIDPTNIITPILSVIARIGLDHTKILGDTVEQISWEKAGIVKPGVPVVLYPQEENIRRVIGAVCQERLAPFYPLDTAQITYRHDEHGADFCLKEESYRINIPGAHQVFNAATAVEALRLLKESGVKISREALSEGLAQTRWPGRLEWVREGVLIDGTHNVQGAQSLAAYMGHFYAGRRVCLVAGILRDKDAHHMVEAFGTFASEVILVAPDSHRATDPEELVRLFAPEITTTVADSVSQALETALKRQKQGDLIVVAGSLYLAGEARRLLSVEKKKDF